ncbi:uncharacterized protein LOC119185819 isoform X4 [Rhipicephalus microplus]
MKKTRSKDVFSGLQASWLVGQKTVHASACSRARQPRACQQEDGMDAHLEVVGVGPRDSVNRLGDFAFEPCIYFFWALLCLLAKAVNAKHLHLEAPCVLSLSEPSPMSSREGSCVPTTPVRSSSPREVRLRSSTLSTPETPKRSPLVNIFRKMKHTRCSSSSDEEPPEAATEETLCRQSVFQRVNSPLRGRNNNTGRWPLTPGLVVFRTRHEHRSLWRKAIQEQVLLTRMEKEERQLQESQDEWSSKRLRLDYGEVEDGPCNAETVKGWDKLLTQPPGGVISPDIIQSEQAIQDYFANRKTVARSAMLRRQVIQGSQDIGGIHCVGVIALL